MSEGKYTPEEAQEFKINEQDHATKPDKYGLVGAPAAVEHIRNAVIKHISEPANTPPEIPHFEERERQLTAIRQEISSFMKEELNIDVSDRVLDNSSIKFFAPKEWDEFAKKEKFPAHADGFFDHNSIYIRELDEESTMLQSVNHEQIHHASNIIFIVRQDGRNVQLAPHRYGLKNNKNLHLIFADETLTEITNIEIVEKRWKNNPVLADINTDALAYPAQVVVMDELIERVATYAGVEKLTMLRALQKGKVLGQAQSLRPITDAISKASMKDFAQAPLDTPDQMFELAAQLGLGNAFQKLEQMRSGVPVTILKGILNPPIEIQFRDGIWRYKAAKNQAA